MPQNPSSIAIIERLIKEERVRKWTIKKVLVDKGSIEDAEDVYQHAFIILWEKLEQGVDIKHPEAFAKKVIETNWNQWSKQLRLRREKFKHYSVDLKIDSVEQSYLRKEHSVLIKKIINRLEEPCRSILYLYYIERKKYKEIAVQLNNGKTFEWVKRKAYYCRKNFKESLKQFSEFKELF